MKKKSDLYSKILVAQILLYLAIFLSGSNKTFFLPIIVFGFFLFWQLEDWKKAVWLVFVAVFPFAWAWRTLSFPAPLPFYFSTPNGSNALYYSIPFSAGLMLIFILLVGLILDTRSDFKGDGKDPLLIIFTVFSLIAVLFSVNTQTAMIGFLGILIPLLIYEVAKYYCREPEMRRLTIQVLILLFLFQGLWATGQFLWQRPLGRILEREITDLPLGIYSIESLSQFRPSGTLGHPNTLSMFLGMILPLTLSQALDRNRLIRYKKLVVFASLFGFLAFIFTLSRWSWFCLLLVSGPFLLNLVRKRGIRRKDLFLALPLLIIFLAIIWPRLTTVSELFVAGTSSLQSRLDLFQETIIMIKDRPFFGVGPGNFLLVLAQNNFTGVAYYFFFPVHSLYLLFASELGILTLIVFLFFVFGHLKDMLMGFLEEGKEQYLRKGILAGVIFYLLAVLGYTGTGVNLETFFLLLGISAAIK